MMRHSKQDISATVLHSSASCTSVQKAWRDVRTRLMQATEAHQHRMATLLNLHAASKQGTLPVVTVL